jgi:hypothetical protein
LEDANVSKECIAFIYSVETRKVWLHRQTAWKMVSKTQGKDTKKWSMIWANENSGHENSKFLGKWS